ncbi:DUF1186 domain-containing protein [Saccharobesus litoralis]|uniref:DUF1186 domain-containing protein n=1 Tax=Saccharobesus litoralis TaxID=2172099 RepID=UPI0019025453|nr:DUF1186 domain-containing protein [Saccharobesus litoralis]
MNLEQIIEELSLDIYAGIPEKALAAAKQNWSDFYPELEKLMVQFAEDSQSLDYDQHALLFWGTWLLIEQKHTSALPLCLKMFAQNDDFGSVVDEVYSDTVTELFSSLFYTLADGDQLILSDFIVANNPALYSKSAAIAAVFVQYESKQISQDQLLEQINRWIDVLLAVESEQNSYLLTMIALHSERYQLESIHPRLIELVDKDVFDLEIVASEDIKNWNKKELKTLIEDGSVVSNFDILDIFQHYNDGVEFDDFDIGEDGKLRFKDESDDEFDDVFSDKGLLADLLYNEQDIIANSVPVTNPNKNLGRNDPCPCGSGKKYKKCCLNKA